METTNIDLVFRLRKHYVDYVQGEDVDMHQVFLDCYEASERIKEFIDAGEKAVNFFNQNCSECEWMKLILELGAKANGTTE